ncbi:MAG: hypothetical protein JF593_12790 [Novosphingobium sp.]|nr:hypothetical protein [Novosphingobium sp.]
MANHPSTFAGGGGGGARRVEWDDSAELHRADDGGGLLNGFKAVRHGTLAELIRFVVALPAAERRRYVIERAGDHKLRADEVMALAARPDFPR